MTNHKRQWISLGTSAILCGCLCIAGLTGCSGEEEAPPVVIAPPPPAPAPPPPPAVTPIDQLMTDLSIDQRVSLPEDKAPNNNADRKAVLVFFDALARGNSQSMKGMLPLSDQIELAALVDSGAWKNTVSKIQKIQIQTGVNSLNQKCALAVIEVGAIGDQSFQPQLWYFNTEQEEPIFEAAATPPGILDKLSGDWIASWHQILADEMAMADKPDADVSISQKDLDDREDEAPTSGRGGGFGAGGGEGGGGPNRIRDPKSRPPVKAPSPGG